MTYLARLATASPRAMLAIVIFSTALAAAGLPRATTDVGYRVFLGENHPEVVKMVELIETFGGGLPVRIVWDCAETPLCESAFDRSALEMAAGISAGLESLPAVRAVLSPATAPLLVSSSSGFEVRTLVEDGVVVPDVAALAIQASTSERWIGNLISSDGQVGSVVVQLSAMDSSTTSSLVHRVLEITRAIEGVNFYLVGDPVDFVVAGGEMQKETATIMPIMIGLIIGVVLLLWRSLAAAGISLGIAGIGVTCAMGTMAWLGWPQMELTQALPPLILVIGTCDALHLLAAVEREPKTLGRELRVMNGVRRVAMPCVVTSATTVIGFLSFASSGIESFVRFAVISTLGIIAALLATFSVVPAALTLLPERVLDGSSETSSRWVSALTALSALVEKRAGLIVRIGLGVMVIAFGGVTRLEVDVDEQRMLGSESLVVGWANAVEDKLRRADSVELSISMPRDVPLESPIAVGMVESILADVAELPEAGRGESYVSLLAEMNQALHEGRREFSRPGASIAENAELLTLLQMGGGGILDSWASPSGGYIRVSIPTSPASRDRTQILLGEIESVTSSHAPPGATFAISGPVAIYNAFVDEIHSTQLWSFASASIGIAIALFVSFLAAGHGVVRTTVWASAAFAVSLLPVIATLGLMGGAGLPLDVGTIMVGAIVLGISVDDSIHWIYAYADMRRDGADPRAAACSATRTTGRALITTSAALAVGFLTLLLSSWQSISAFGGLSAVAIVAALLADLLLLPSVFLLVHGNVNGPAEPKEPT